MPTITEKDLPRPLTRSCQPNLERIDKGIANPLPTPEKGAKVGWMPQARYGQMGREGLPATVLQKIGPGQVSLEVHGLAEHQGRLKPGCTYIAHPDVAKGGKAGRSTYGYWYYLESERDPEFKPPRPDFEWHKKELQGQRQRCLQDELQRQKEAIEREQEEAEQEKLTAAAK